MEGRPGPSARVTIRTVASDAGVSVAAVSKVLRNAYGVSEALRGRVQASIDKLGYRPSTAARAMRGRTYTVGVLVIDLHNPFVPDIVDGANAALATSGYKALIGVGQSKVALEVRAGRVDDRSQHGRADPDRPPPAARGDPTLRHDEADRHHRPSLLGRDHASTP